MNNKFQDRLLPLWQLFIESINLLEIQLFITIVTFVAIETKHCTLSKFIFYVLLILLKIIQE